jgi:hypothetical protein
MRRGVIQLDNLLAVAYLRHSPKPAAKRNMASIDLQRKQIEDYCKLLGFTIKREIVVPFVSARKVPFLKRGGQEVLQACKETNARNIVIQRVDRAFRNTADGLTFSNLLTRKGLKLHLAAEGGVMADTSTAAGQMFLTMRLAFAAYEPQLTAERTSSALRERLTDMLINTPDTPFGFLIPDPNDRVDGNGGGCWRMDFCWWEVRTIKAIHQMRMEEMMEYTAIAAKLNAHAAIDPLWSRRNKVPWDRRSVRLVYSGVQRRGLLERCLEYRR